MQQNDRSEAFDLDLWEEMCRASGLYRVAERAHALGLSESTVSRVQAGIDRPGLRFANGCRRLFGLEVYARLFPLPTEETTDANS